MKIFLDVDGVLADWMGQFCKDYGVNTANPTIQHMIETNWDICCIVREEMVWDLVNKGGADWWANLPLFPWTMQLYHWLCQKGEVCLLTSPSDDPSSVVGKIKWIEKHFNTKNYLIGKPKQFCASCGSVLIDDSSRNVDKFFNAGGNAWEWTNSELLKKQGWTVEISNLEKWLDGLSSREIMVPAVRHASGTVD